jgi:hypothetical protein
VRRRWQATRTSGWEPALPHDALEPSWRTA